MICILPYNKGTVFFFFRGHGRWSFIHSNPKIVYFFFSREAGKKKYSCFFFFPEEKFIGHSIRFWWSFLFFNKSCLYFFFRIFVCFFVFFLFHGKVQVSFIHSTFLAEKKKQTGKKKQLFHSFIRNSSKMRKNELFRGNKKIRYLWLNN